MKIILDAMGGDNAPQAIVQGAVDAQEEFGVDIVLVGREAEVRICLERCDAAKNPHIEVRNAEEVIDMHDEPSMACRRKKDSSMTVALRMLADGEGDAAISAGSTGALLTGATLIVKRIRGIRRAAFAPVLPNGGQGVVLIDCGANVECTPEYLLQFGFMGSFYAERVLGIKNPRVGLLSNGAEDSKGTELVKAAHLLLKAAGEDGRINFIGNVEGGDAFSGIADVIVTDGYSGNILLKCAESTAKFLMKNIRAALMTSMKTKVGALLIKKDLYGIKKMMDVKEIGGTPFLGITGPVIKAHGNSDARAIRSAVKQAISFAEAGVSHMIEENIEYMKLAADEQQESIGGT